ncbi:hypothetical protein TNCV_252591 [Trichonephila clavipes]|nr:hypothetical protein TNCV_252591 [Trichonephila clavipes]
MTFDTVDGFTANYLGFLLRLSRLPPPTPCHLVIFYVTPASQSGSSMLPIKVYSTVPGNIHYSCSGTEERFAFHVPLNLPQSSTGPSSCRVNEHKRRRKQEVRGAHDF